MKPLRSLTKPAVILSAAILTSGVIVGTALNGLRKAVERHGLVLARQPSGPAPLHGQITVVPPPGGFRLAESGGQTRDAGNSGAAVPAREAFSQVTNVRLVESRVTAAQLEAASKLILGRWRDENSYVEYRADGTCSWRLDSGTVKNNKWRTEGEMIFEEGGEGEKVQRRILELDDHHFVYQQFPAGTIWRAARVPAAAVPAEKPAQ